MAIASAFFFLQPQFLVSRKQHGSTYGKMPYEIAEELGSSISSYDRVAIVRKHQPSVISPGAKLPLGLQRKSLRVVVTGGAGFVGSHLVDKLMARGDSVIVVDNFFTGRKENVMHHFGNPRFELIRHDVVEPLLLEVDQIYHLACPASPVHYKFNPVKTIISLSCPCSHSSLIVDLFHDYYFCALVLFQDHHHSVVKSSPLLRGSDSHSLHDCWQVFSSLSEALMVKTLILFVQDKCCRNPQHAGAGKADRCTLLAH
jgi:hypothetical protein